MGAISVTHTVTTRSDLAVEDDTGVSLNAIGPCSIIKPHYCFRLLSW